MRYHIPSDEQVELALEKVLGSFRIVSSQHKLHSLVVKELQTGKTSYGVSSKRLRDIALRSANVKLEIHSREGDPDKILTKCPVCGSTLQRVKNQTIWGGEVTLEFRCTYCSYWTGKKKRIPTRYVFHLKKTVKRGTKNR
jgi:hypothetical protein